MAQGHTAQQVGRLTLNPLACDSKVASLHHTWEPPSLATPLMSPEGFLDVRALIFSAS